MWFEIEAQKQMLTGGPSIWSTNQVRQSENREPPISPPALLLYNRVPHLS